MIPSVGTPVGFKDIVNGFLSRGSFDRFGETIGKHEEKACPVSEFRHHGLFSHPQGIAKAFQ
jgi:hypothetical protein